MSRTGQLTTPYRCGPQPRMPQVTSSSGTGSARDAGQTCRRLGVNDQRRHVAQLREIPHQLKDAHQNERNSTSRTSQMSCCPETWALPLPRMYQVA